MKAKQKETNRVTELVFILDRSGSMSGLEADTIGGFNAMLKKQKEEPGTCYVTTVLFDNFSTTIHDRVPIERVDPLTERDYQPGGCTALLDALGDTIRHIASIHRYARPEDVPGQTLFVITTDGLENASRRFGADQVRRMISHEQEKYGWEFLFVAANIDAVETAERYGIRRNRAVNYHADRRGTGVVFDAVSDAVGAVRAAAPLADSWSASIDADYKSREKDAD